MTQALQLDPADPSALMNMAIIQYKKGQADAAMLGFSKVADLMPGDPRPIEYIAAMLIENNQWRDASDMLAEAARRDAHSASIQTAQALVDLNITSATAARTRLLQVLNMDPSYAPALFNLAVIDRDWLKNPGEARKYFQRYLALTKNDPHTPIARAALAEKSAPPPHVKNEVVQLDAFAPAEVHKKGVRKPVPAPVTEPVSDSTPAPVATARNPAEAASVFALGVRHHQAGEVDQAIQEYTRATRLDPNMVRAHYNLGLLLRSKGELPRARDAFEHAIEGAPGMIDAHYMLALVLLDQGNENGAIEHLKTITAKAPKHADAHLALGMIYKKDKARRDLARKELSTYLELAPNGTSAREIRNWLNYQR